MDDMVVLESLETYAKHDRKNVSVFCLLISIVLNSKKKEKVFLACKFLRLSRILRWLNLLDLISS